MDRDPRIDPQVGDMLHHPRFGGGCLFEVVKRKPHATHGEAIQVELTLDDGRNLKPRWRIYSLRLWPEFAAEMTFRGKRGDTTPGGGDG